MVQTVNDYDSAVSETQNSAVNNIPNGYFIL